MSNEATRRFVPGADQGVKRVGKNLRVCCDSLSIERDIIWSSIW